jgi:hypothetical protein
LLLYLQYARLIGAVTLLQAAPISLTQHRINVFAGKCVSAQLAMSGLKGAKIPGETPGQYNLRIKSYLSALDATEKALSGLKQMPALVHSTPENEKLWKDIVANVAKLEREVKDAHAAWTSVPKMGEKAKLGPKLLQVLNSVQAILSGLRDARP